MHACAALLESRKQLHPGAKFSNSETKLLYTLHWIILDAASECDDNTTISDTKNTVAPVLLHPLKTIQLFVYLFAPLVNTLEDSDFQSLKLENGLRLWQPLWDYQQPDVPCFSTPVKPQRNVLKAQRNLIKINTNAANIYIGKGTSTENLRFVSPFDAESVQSTESEASPTRLAPLARMSDSDFCFMSQSESQSIFSVCEFCSNVKSSRANEGPSVCRCGRKDSYVDVGPENRQAVLEKLGSLDRDFQKHMLASAAMSGVKGGTYVDVLSASYFDVSVLQCLFCLQWSVDGIHWALKYMHQRLLEISDEYLHMDILDRERSRSLPFSEPGLLRSNSIPLQQSRSKEPGPMGIPKSASSTSQKFASMSPDLSTIPSDSEPTSPAIKPFLSELRREPPFKKVCMVELRQYPDSTKAYVTRKQSPSRTDASPTRIAFKTRLDQYPPPKTHREYSSIYNWNTNAGRASVDITRKLSSSKEKTVKTSQSWGNDLGATCNKFETMPSPDQDSEASSQHSSNDSSSISHAGDTAYQSGTMAGRFGIAGKPIITITADTPQRTKPTWPQVFDFSKPEIMEPEGAEGGDLSGTGMSRSMTDSNICYKQEEEVHEVAGAVHYIQKNGHINYKVILQVSTETFSLRSNYFLHFSYLDGKHAASYLKLQ